MILQQVTPTSDTLCDPATKWLMNTSTTPITNIDRLTAYDSTRTDYLDSRISSYEWVAYKLRSIDNKIKKSNEIKEDTNMNYKHRIIDYKFVNGKTTIKWNDGTVTKCYTDPEKADAYVGFMIALAKKFMGNKNEATNLADYWINKVPARRRRAELKAERERIEQIRIENKRRERKEKYRLRIAAIKRKEAYEAAKLANELYGVPLSFRRDNKPE